MERGVVKVTEELLHLALENSFLVVGEPGAGKSGVLYDLAERASASGFDVVVFSAEDIASPNLNAFQLELNLSHGLTDVLDNAQGRHDYTCERHRVLQVAIDEISPRVEPLAS